MNWTSSFIWALGFSALAGVIVAVAGGVLTVIGPWYENLRKPSWKPPDWAFGPIWSTIIILAVISAALAWDAADSASAKTAVLTVLVVNAILNIAWSGIFFKLRRPDWALVEVLMLWLSIVALILVLGSHSTTAGLLMVPYLVWVSIAAFLNYRIVQMNKPFA
jgi:tryptophan-rich sensory protein